MNEDIIANHNKVVSPEDDVYILGDVAFGNNPKVARELVSRLNGNLHLIAGNHDKKFIKQCAGLAIILPPLYELYVSDPTAHGNKRLVVLCHYAMRVWNKSHWGMKSSIQLYGHSHGSLEYDNPSASMDVGVDNAARLLGEYRPFSYEEVVTFIGKKME